MLDANECREHAERCMTQATQTTNPIVKERLIETAQGWRRLAADFETYPDRTHGFHERLKRLRPMSASASVGAPKING